MISAKVVADSKNEFGNRITTMVVTFPRIILAEFNTHRMFSRNSASSRAIPLAKMIESVRKTPFIPLAFQKDHKGMQGTEYFEGEDHLKCIENWKNAGLDAYMSVMRLRSLNRNGLSDLNYLEADSNDLPKVTKQLCNRLLEPFIYHTVIVTATEWENFFALRCPQYSIPELNGIFRSKKDYIKASKEQNNLIEKIEDYSIIQWLKINKGQAEIHMMALAEAMWDAYNESTPKELKAGEWHIPFLDEILSRVDATIDLQEFKEQWWNYLIKIATVMAARTSYTVVGDDLKPLSVERMIEIHDNMLKANPKHMSPFEHCAKTMSIEEWNMSGNNSIQINQDVTTTKGWSGNFRGFIQYRKLIPNENITK